METIAFIGTGVMGSSMASHLLQKGYPLVVYNRTKAKAEQLLQSGAVWAGSPGDAAAKADVVITIVGFPKDVEDTYLAPNGVIDRARKETILIDMTTSSPALAKRIAQTAAGKGIFSLDAPVSGGDLGARNAALSIMVGGEQAAFDKALPVFECMGKNIVLQGGPGAGQHCKMSNQIAIASGMMAVSEALLYAARAGLHPKTMLKSIETGAAGSWSLSNLAPRMLAGNFAPGFFVKHFIKDMGIALASAKEMGISLPGLEKAEQLYKTLAAMTREQLELAARKAATLAQNETPFAEFKDGISSGGDLGTQALFLLYVSGATI
jgi:3-hydroxyisobutyrate dehydrogenase